MACGYNFSLGLTSTHRVYFWGNKKYYDYKQKKDDKDILDPMPMEGDLENDEVKMITACYKMCYALTEKGTLYQWGRFLANKKPKGKYGSKAEPM